MIRITPAQVHPIGLDIGSDSVKMLQLERVGDSLSVLAAARQPLPSEARLEPQLRMAMAAEVVRQMLRTRGFRGTEVVACVPRDILQIKTLRLPQTAAIELPAVVRSAAKGALPFDPAEAHLQFMPAGEVRQGSEVQQEIILMAARHSEINSFLESLHRCGATVNSLDVEPCALYRTTDKFIRRHEDELEVNVLVQVGLERTQVVIGRGHDISFIKVIDVGGRHFHEAVSRKLGITSDEAQALRRRLAETPDAHDPGAKRDPVRQAAFDATRCVMEDLGREISLSLRYHSVTFRGQRPSRLKLIGGEAGDKHLETTLRASLSIPIDIGRPLHSIDTSRMMPIDRRGSMSEWTLVLGLALKRTQGLFGPRDGKPRDPTGPRPDLPSASTPGQRLANLNRAMKAEAQKEPVHA